MAAVIRAVEHDGVVQLWDLFVDGAWCGSRRIPNYLPVDLLLPLPYECRSVALHGTLTVRLRHTKSRLTPPRQDRYKKP